MQRPPRGAAGGPAASPLRVRAAATHRARCAAQQHRSPAPVRSSCARRAGACREQCVRAHTPPPPRSSCCVTHAAAAPAPPAHRCLPARPPPHRPPARPTPGRGRGDGACQQLRHRPTPPTFQHATTLQVFFARRTSPRSLGGIPPRWGPQSPSAAELLDVNVSAPIHIGAVCLWHLRPRNRLTGVRTTSAKQAGGVRMQPPVRVQQKVLPVNL